jgi:ComF family protein
MGILVDRRLDRLAGWLLPPRCVLCHGRGQWPALDLCAACEGDLPALAGCCPRCALPRATGTASHECGRCRRDPPPYARCHAPFDYDFPVDGMIQSLKYGRQLAMARVLGTLLAVSVLSVGLHLDVDVLLPVPLHPGKLAERGFNQSIEIARWTARLVRRPCAVQTLLRTRPTRPQVGLPLAERVTNLHGAFTVAGSVRGKRVAVIDDVVTTGSTVREVAMALRRADASSVDIWCVARTRA